MQVCHCDWMPTASGLSAGLVEGAKPAQMEVRERRRYRRSGKVGNLALPCLRAISQESSFPTAPHPARLLTRRQHPPTAFVSHDTARHSSHGTARTASGFAISSRLSCRILSFFASFFCRDTGLDRARLKKVEERVCPGSVGKLSDRYKKTATSLVSTTPLVGLVFSRLGRLSIVCVSPPYNPANASKISNHTLLRNFQVNCNSASLLSHSQLYGKVPSNSPS